MARIARALWSFTASAVALAACSITEPLTAPPTTTEPQLGVDGLALTDGSSALRTISFDEYTAALDDLGACMVEAGGALTGRILDPVTGLYIYDYDPAYEQIHQDCYATHLATVEDLYRAGPRDDSVVGDFEEGPAGVLGDLADDSWVRLLATVPDAPETRFNPVVLIDLARTRTAHDIALPGAGASDQAVVDYMAELTNQAGLLPIGPMASFGRRTTPTAMRLEVGFDSRTWDQLIEAGAGDAIHLAVVGRFDPASIDEAVERDPVWSELLTTLSHDAHTIYEWGADGGLDLERRTPVRPIGEHRRLAVSGRHLLWSRFTAVVEDALDAIDGNRRTLADVPELRRLGEFADEQGLLSGLMTMRLTPYIGYADNGRIESVLLDQPVALMFADGVDEKGPHMSVVLLYDSADSAADNLERFELRIADTAATTVAEETFVPLDEPREYEIVQLDDIVYARVYKTRDSLPPPLTIVRLG